VDASYNAMCFFEAYYNDMWQILTFINITWKNNATCQNIICTCQYGGHNVGHVPYN